MTYDVCNLCNKISVSVLTIWTCPVGQFFWIMVAQTKNLLPQAIGQPNCGTWFLMSRFLKVTNFSITRSHFGSYQFWYSSCVRYNKRTTCDALRQNREQVVQAYFEIWTIEVDKGVKNDSLVDFDIFFSIPEYVFYHPHVIFDWFSNIFP